MPSLFRLFGWARCSVTDDEGAWFELDAVGFEGSSAASIETLARRNRSEARVLSVLCWMMKAFALAVNRWGIDLARSLQYGAEDGEVGDARWS